MIILIVFPFFWSRAINLYDCDVQKYSSFQVLCRTQISEKEVRLLSIHDIHAVL